LNADIPLPLRDRSVKHRWSVALYALLCIIWGSTWLVIKVGYGGLGPFNVAAIRFFLAGALLVPLVPTLGARWPRGGTEWSLVASALNAPAMLIGAVALFAASLAAGDGFRLPQDTSTWGAIGYLAVAGSVVTFLGYFSLLKKWSVTSLSFISVFTPAIALLLGFLLLDERPTFLTVIGGVLILLGVTLALALGHQNRSTIGFRYPRRG
jgi:drug/metabolite transporter (DMT)-like permease